MSANTATPNSPAGAGSSPSPLFGWFYRRSKWEPDHVIALCDGHAYLAGRGWKAGSGDMPNLPPADKCCVCMGTATIRRMINAPLKPNATLSQFGGRKGSTMTPSTSPPSELGAAHGWALLPATQRNLTIAKLIGAKLLSQFYLYIDGKEYSPLPHQAHEKEKAEGLAAYARSEGWAEFSARHGLKDEWRESVEARLIEWPLRYSDTPGGGWDVIEAMRNQGWNIEVASTGDGWMVTIDDNDPHHGRIIEHGPTMQTAACLAALRCPWPNDRTELRLPGSAATTTPKT